MNTLTDKLAGRFLVVDGPDGTGKSTQIQRLCAWLRDAGAAVTAVRDPGGTAIGDRIRAILLDPLHAEMAVRCETMLYMASRAQLVEQIVRPALARGECVLCDRYISATVAYQGAGGMDPDLVRSVGEAAVGGLWPDLTLLLDLPPEVGLSRIRGTLDRVEAKDLAYHRRVRDIFLRQAQEAPERFRVLDASGTPEDVQSRIRQALETWAST